MTIFSKMLLLCYYLGGVGPARGEYFKTTEFIHPNGSTTEGPIELPEGRAGHCMVEYAGIVILMGGVTIGEYVTHNCQFFLQYLKSVNLQFNTVGRQDDDMIVPPSNGPMFILID